MNDPLRPMLERRGVVVLDGGLASELERRGADLNDPLWSARLLLENPDLIRAVHLDYLRAGANVVTTASYQASFAGLARRGLDRSAAAEVFRRSVRLARAACAAYREERPDAPVPLVAASVGCYGAFLADGSEYRGDYGLTQRQLIDWHRPRLEVLAACGADLLACETLPCLVEGEALARLLEEFPEVPAWLSFSCRDGEHLRHGEKFADAAALAEALPNLVAVGVNCTDPQLVGELLARGAASTRKPLLAYPNGGDGWDPAAKRWVEAATPFDWSAGAREWHAAGARLLGGCCRTTPATIRLLEEAVRRFARG